MSAIAGVLNYNEASVSIETIQDMMQALQKYPADDVHTWHGGSVCFGCHMQWITPESVHERLPYYDEHNKLSITADAIIDNREELFNRLQVEYPRRRQMTDSELILLAYRKWGKDAPNYLIGDFAFVIWDENERILFGARDLLGNRTLYYHHNGRQFAFCTVISPLFTLPGVKKKLNESWFAEYLAIPTILDAVDVHTTVYDKIQHIPPAHAFTVMDGKLTLKQYGTLAPPAEQLKLKSNGEYEEAFRAVFQESVTSKLRSHRQVGASLSGGLDSGAVVSFAANPLRSAGKILHTYSYIPPSDFVDWTSKGRFANESPYIKETVQHVGNISAHYLEFKERNSFAEINDWLSLLEAPYKCFENSFWMTGIFEQAKQHGVGVLLTGAGGNLTISWGSAIDYYAMLLRKFRLVQFNRELSLFSNHMKIGRSRLLRMIMESAFPLLDRSNYNNTQDFPSLIHPDFAKKSNVLEKLRNRDIGMPDPKIDFIQARENEFKNLVFPHMTGALETQLSLRYAIWERDPTYDPRVIRFCLSVPIEQYVQDGIDRSLIRRATKGYLPDKVRLNQRFRGIQGADWVHRMMPSWRAFTEELRQLCRDSACEQFLNINQIRKSLSAIGDSPRPDQAYDPNARFLMRSLIVYRFMKQMA